MKIPRVSCLEVRAIPYHLQWRKRIWRRRYIKCYFTVAYEIQNLLLEES